MLALTAFALLAPSAGAALSNKADGTFALDAAAGPATVDAIYSNGGSAWIGGDFTQAGSQSGPGTPFDALTGNWAGSGVATATGSGGDVAVDAVAADGSGGWYVAGAFENEVQSGTVLARPNLMHITSTGAPDATFNPPTGGASIDALAYDPGTNTLYAGGDFTINGGATHLTAVNGTTGSQVIAFAPVVNGNSVNAIVVNGGELYIGGDFTDVNGAAASANAAEVLTSDGSTDTQWNPNPDLPVSALAVGGSGVFVAGQFTVIDGDPGEPGLAKVGPVNGAVDTTFQPLPTGGDVDALAVAGSTLYAGGSFSAIKGTAEANLAAVDVTGNGTPLAFPDTDGEVIALAVSGTSLYVGGTFGTLGASTHRNIGRISTTTGLVDGAISSSAGGRVNAIAATASQFYVGGFFASVQDVARTGLVEMELSHGGANPLNVSFTGGTVDAIINNNGVLYVGGSFTGETDANGAHAIADVVAIDRTSGNVITTWNPGFNGAVSSLAIGDNNTILVGGAFTTPRLGAAEVLQFAQSSTGALTTWNAALDGAVTALYQIDGFYYLAGAFTTAGGQARAGLAAITPGSSLADPNWNPAPTGGSVDAIAATGPGAVPEHIYAGGDFTTIGGAARNGVAQLPAAGNGALATATGWNPNVTGGSVSSLSVAPSGTVYAGGDFTTVAGAAHQYAVQIDPTSGAPTSWSPAPSSPVTAVATAPTDERVYLGGRFMSTRSAPAAGIAAYSEPPVVRSGVMSVDDPVAGQTAGCNTPLFGGSFPQTYSTFWELDGAEIPGTASTFTYTPTDADVGHQLTCSDHVSNLGYSSSFTSPPKTVAARPTTGGGSGGGGSTGGTDPGTGSSSSGGGSVTTPVPVGDIDGQPTPPAPEAGKTVIAEPVQGVVTVLLPGKTKPVPLPDAENVPVKTIVDTTGGRVTLTTVGANGVIQSATFYGGKFQIVQAGGKSPVVDLKLFGNSFKACPAIKRSTAKRAAAAKKKVKKLPKTKSIRHLWGTGKGLFRTDGRFASATIRGTTWLTDDRCDGTLVRVTKGAVTVHDIPRNKSFALKAPKQYLAHP